jgi:hypothetical protein
MLLMKVDIMQPIESVLKSSVPEDIISVLQVVVNLTFSSDAVASKMLTKEVMKSLKLLCAHKEMKVQQLALLAVGNLAFCWENRRTLVASESLRELLIRLSAGPTSCISKAATRALAILGENKYLRRAIKGKVIGKQGLHILSIDGYLLIDSAVRNIPKVFVLSSLVNVTQARPFLFRNYQYPAGTPEVISWTTEGSATYMLGQPATAVSLTTQMGERCTYFVGSCKHYVWEAIRVSSAAPYYLDDFADDANRWQDGAIVANNQTLIAIREAQLLCPDTRIGCLVSIGCGSVPTKPRGKGGWRYLDTGQVLIESACSVEHVEEALDALLPMLPDIQLLSLQSSR